MKAYFFERGNVIGLSCPRPEGCQAASWYSRLSQREDFIGDEQSVEVGRCRKQYKRLTDFVLTGGGGGELCVSDRVREAVESVEAGVHQFLPYDLQLPDGSPFPVRYWGLNVRHHVDCYKWGKHTFFPAEKRLQRPPSHEDDPISLYYPRQPEDLVLYRDRVEGLHLWRERRARALFLSDTMAAAFKRLKVNSYKLYETTLA